MTKIKRVVKHRTILGSWGSGWMTPQLLIQVTPLCWKFEFLLQLTNSRPVKAGLAVGPIAVVLYFGKAGYGVRKGYSDQTSSTFRE